MFNGNRHVIRTNMQQNFYSAACVGVIIRGDSEVLKPLDTENH